MKKFYITTPIYYVNDKPHIGHSYTTILADVLARYHRLMGEPTFFLTGTDEHGQKVQEAAQRSGVTPQAHADATVVRFQELWQRLGITNDDFIRTTEWRHKTIVQQILQDLFDRDEIYRADYDGWYCVTCERFFTEKDLVDGHCPESGCGRPVQKIRETNYFFRMSKYQDWLIKHIEDNPGFIQPDFRRNETLGFLKKKLQDLCISRPKSRLSWGIELPFDKDFVTYVWFDALCNYITAVGYRSDEVAFAKWWPVSCHLIGKDILTTHTVYWPTMLRAMGVAMPDCVFAHGWWLSGKDKMSKSAGNVVNPMDVLDKYGVDAFRYFLMSEMSLGQDASFTEDSFVRRYNADLANDLGNLVSRTLKLIHSYCGGLVPDPPASVRRDAGLTGEEKALRDVAIGAVEKLVASVHDMRLDLGLAAVADSVRELNRYLEKKQPWTMAKQGVGDELKTVLYCALEVLRIVSTVLHPVMPGKMLDLRQCLGLGAGGLELSAAATWGLLEPGQPVGQAVILFPKLLPKEEEKVVATVAPTTTVAQPDVAGVIQIEYVDFQKVQLRTAKVLQAEKMEGADKLLKLQIEVGADKRQLVAGIALHYTPEQLIGRTVIVVANLKTAKIRGVESNGMLLAASSGSTMKLVTVDGDLPSGSTVK